MLKEEYDKLYNKYDKCLECLEELLIIAAKQENYEIGKRIEKLLNELK